MRAKAPIFAADAVIEESAIEFEGEDVNEEEIVDEFKRFLDRVSAEEFAEADVGGGRRRVRGYACAFRPAVEELSTELCAGCADPSFGDLLVGSRGPPRAEGNGPAPRVGGRSHG